MTASRVSVPFQSTCPARGTTPEVRASALRTSNFNPRAPRGARRAENVGFWGRLWISIHVPREGHDAFSVKSLKYRSLFQSTCPARGTTEFAYIAELMSGISIHVPREGHDHLQLPLQLRR